MFEIFCSQLSVYSVRFFVKSIYFRKSQYFNVYFEKIACGASSKLYLASLRGLIQIILRIATRCVELFALPRSHSFYIVKRITFFWNNFEKKVGSKKLKKFRGGTVYITIPASLLNKVFRERINNCYYAINNFQFSFIIL